MNIQGLEFKHEYPPKADVDRHVRALQAEQSDHSDTAVRQICSDITNQSPSFRPICVYDSGELIGIVTSARLKENNFHFVFIMHLAVIPRFQRKGIGSMLLEMVKLTAGDIPIVVRNINDVAFRSLEKAGFWKIPGHAENVVYKWSDREEHKNNDVPYVEDEPLPDFKSLGWRFRPSPSPPPCFAQNLPPRHPAVPPATRRNEPVHPSPLPEAPTPPPVTPQGQVN